jgi:NAD(P)-dependent dehydrogenase (short-subunit alcohol dehydrogenase family)
MDAPTPRPGASPAWLLLGGGAAALALRALTTRARALDLRDRTVLVTGGSRGLGLLLAREFAAHGAAVAVCGRDPDTLARAREDLQGRGARVLAVPCDVTRPQEVDALVGRVGRELGPIDVLVNNAGVITVGPLATMTRDDFEEALRTNFWGAVHTTLAVLPEMRRRRAGRIVNVTSIGGKLGLPHLVPYSASKFAMVGFSEGLRAELARDGVRVTTAVPGLMRTGSPRNATFKSRHRAEYAWFSVADALPLLSMDAERAARRIVAACRRGEAEIVLSLPARLAVTAQGLAPGVTADLLGLVNRGLPAPGGIGPGRAAGRDSESAVAPSWLTAPGDRAARRNNQLA